MFVCNLLTYVVSFIMVRTCLTSLREKTVNEYGRKKEVCFHNTQSNHTITLEAIYTVNNGLGHSRGYLYGQ